MAINFYALGTEDTLQEVNENTKRTSLAESPNVSSTYF